MGMYLIVHAIDMGNGKESTIARWNHSDLSCIEITIKFLILINCATHALHTSTMSIKTNWTSLKYINTSVKYNKKRKYISVYILLKSRQINKRVEYWNINSAQSVIWLITCDNTLQRCELMINITKFWSAKSIYMFKIYRI